MPAPTGMSGPIPRSDGSPPNNWPSVFGGRAWEWNPTPRAVLLPQFPDRAARPQLPQSGGAGRGARRHALLARARRRRLPPRYRQLLLPRRSSCGTIRRRGGPSICPMRSIPTTCRSTATRKSQPENVDVPQARAQAARRVSRHHHGRRGRRQPQGPAADGRIHLGRRQAAHGLHLRHARPRVHRRAFPHRDARSSSPARRTAGPAGAFPTTTCTAT